MRTYSRTDDPHRALELDAGDPQRGDDVRALQSACRRRLDARNIERPLSIDGVFGRQTRDACDTAAWALGARQATVNTPELSIGAQRLIRFPGRRADAQLERAEQRMAELQRDREQAEREQPDGGGLTDAQRSEARRRAVDAMGLAYRNRGVVHYTQGPRRWDGIRQRLRSAEGQFPRYADCSSLTTWALWNALTGVGGMDFADVVNGLGWAAGYTGTQLTHGRRVDDLMPGDLVLYGRGWPGMHVAMYRGDGMVYSHGSESGPHLLAVRYRGDVMQFRRYI